MFRSNIVLHQLRQYYILIFLAFLFYLLYYIPHTTIIIIQPNNLTSEEKDLLNANGFDVIPESFDEYNDSEFKNQDSKLLFINTSSCKVPYVDPFTPELLKIYKPPKYEACTNESDLVTPIFNPILKRYILHINETLARKLMNSSNEEYNCCYEEIIRSKKGDTYEDPLPRKYFSQDYVMPLHVEGMLVECHLSSNISHKLQRDAFFLVQHKVPDYVNKNQVHRSKFSKTKFPPRKPSVIFFGIDSLSRINFRRTMPKVFEHLSNRRGWYELQGYNKVADNTVPNLLAVLSGYNSTNTMCNIFKRGCIDKFPIIWKDFKKAGYLTAYAEDDSFLSTFNYVIPGFQTQPTDYYPRPFLKATENNLPCTYKLRRYCVGRRVMNSYVYDLCRQYMKHFVKERPIFGLFWSNHFSHESWEMPALMNDNILQYLLDFEQDGVMESTIMIFLSDHGFRSGGLLSLREGFLEERLPTMFIWLPPWFRKQYPDYAKALEINRNRLTSNYDLHMTLKHILQLGASHDLKLPPAFDCPKCQSVFYPVPENRTCADAGIIDHWCTCNPYTIVTRHEYARKIPYLVADRMNDYFKAKNLSKQCSNLVPRYLDLIELKLNLNKKGEHITQDVDTYRTKFTVNPNGAEFQATVRFNNRTKVVDVDVETISRLTRYHNDSLCINDKEAKKFCICYSSIKKKS